MRIAKSQKIALFVDDDMEFIGMISDIIQHPHFEVRTSYAADGYQAVDQVIKTKPDILFIDFNLPRANGGQILSILKSVKMLSDMRIYFLTAYAEKEILPFVEGLEFHGVLNKKENLDSEIIKILNELDHSLATWSPTNFLQTASKITNNVICPKRAFSL